LHLSMGINLGMLDHVCIEHANANCADNGKRVFFCKALPKLFARHVMQHVD
jgi:hypothetical protein